MTKAFGITALLTALFMAGAVPAMAQSDSSEYAIVANKQMVGSSISTT